MSKASNYKSQHWIPQSYLRSWCDPKSPSNYDPYVWCFPKESNIGKKKGIKNLFRITDMYTTTYTDGERDTRLEELLGRIESEFYNVRKKIIQREYLSNDDLASLSIFIAAMQNRTQKQEKHMQNQWGNIYTQMEKMKQNFERATEEERNKIRNFSPTLAEDESGHSMSEIKRLAEKPLQESLWTFIVEQSKLFAFMGITILCTEDNTGFITSDAPCCWFDPEIRKLPPIFRSPGLGSSTIEVTIPISHSRLALISHRTEWNRYVDVPLSLVDELNRRTRGYAEEYFVSNSQKSKPIWYNLGIKPDL